MHRASAIRAGRLAAVLMAGASLAACAAITPKYAVREGDAAPRAQAQAPSPGAPRLKGTNQPYQVGGIWYVPHDQPHYDETGIASWYGDAFNMKATADGEIFDMSQFSAAHTTLPLPSLVEVTNLDNGRKMTVRVNDRGPFVGGRIIDLSRAAAQELGYDRAGIAHVRVRYVGPAPLAGPEAGVRYAKATPTRTPSPMAAVMRRPADEEIFEEASLTTPAPAPKPLVAPPESVSVSSLAPLPAVRSSREVPHEAPQDINGGAAPIRSASRDVYGPVVRPVTAQSSRLAAYRIQAGAFGDEEHARRAVAQLSATGTATIEPIERGGTTLYRVVIPAPADEAEAFAMRDKVAEIGFADARVLRP